MKMKIPFSIRLMALFAFISSFFYRQIKWLCGLLAADVYVGKFIERVPHGSIVLFPCKQSTLFCGIAGIVAFKQKKPAENGLDLAALEKLIGQTEANGYSACAAANRLDHDDYLGGKEKIEALWRKVHAFNTDTPFFLIFSDEKAQRHLRQMAKRLAALTVTESDLLTEQMGHLSAERVELMARAIEKLKDIHWRLENDILANTKKMRNLLEKGPENPSAASIGLFKRLNAVLNSIDRLEVRGRDSAGISIMFIIDEADFKKGQETLEQAGLLAQFNERCDPDPLINGGINCRTSIRDDEKRQVAVAVTYKIALEIGSLGNNVSYLRRQIADDAVFQILAAIPADFDTVLAHTRWASVGAITEANCHPVDNHTTGPKSASCGIIHTCLNGDIDNFQRLKVE
ncbi:MAG: glutamine--fructose-6-phosphate aminotransferase, partial [Desulfobacterales bacterium]